MLLDVFAGCYDDPKDIRQIRQMIIERGAHLRLVDGTLQVTIYSMDLPKYQIAAEKNNGGRSKCKEFRNWGEGSGDPELMQVNIPQVNDV